MAPAGRLQPLLLQARADRFGHDPRRPFVSPAWCGYIGAARCRPPSRACRRSARGRGRAHPVRRRQGELTRRGARRGGTSASPREKRRAERRCAASIARASWPCRRIQSRWRALKEVTSFGSRRRNGHRGLLAVVLMAVRARSLTRAYLHGSLIARARAGTVAPSWPNPAERSRPSLADNHTMIRRGLRMVTDAGTRTNHRRRGGDVEQRDAGPATGRSLHQAQPRRESQPLSVPCADCAFMACIDALLPSPGASLRRLGRARPLRTTSERADRSPAGVCFALAEQASEHAGSARLVLGRGGRS